MRRIDLLITQSRRSTENLDFTEDAGIQDEEILRYFNDGQDELYRTIQNVFPDMFQSEKIIQCASEQEAYEIPDDCYIGQRIDMVEYSRSGQEKDYYTLKKGDKRERLNGSSGNPSFYIRRGGEILIQPRPEGTGKLRVLYQKTIPTLDIRRAVVFSATLATSTITALTLDTTQALDDTSLLEDGFITIVDKNGVVKMRYIPITAIDTATGVVTIDAGFEFESGETIAAGDYVLRGKYSSTHSVLPDPFESYLLEYANTRTLIRDSSADSAELASLLDRISAGIQKTVSEPDGDVSQVTVLDTQYISYGDIY